MTRRSCQAVLSPAEAARTPAGPKIVFISLRDDSNELYVISVDGSAAAQIALPLERDA